MTQYFEKETNIFGHPIRNYEEVRKITSGSRVEALFIENHMLVYYICPCGM